MTKKNIFLLLTILGFIAPYYFFFQLPAENEFPLFDPIISKLLFFANNFMKGVVMESDGFGDRVLVFMFAEANKLQNEEPLGTRVGNPVGKSFLCTSTVPLFSRTDNGK